MYFSEKGNRLLGQSGTILSMERTNTDRVHEGKGLRHAICFSYHKTRIMFEVFLSNIHLNPDHHFKYNDFI